MLSRRDPVLPCPCPKARTKSLPRSLFPASQGGTASLAPWWPFMFIPRIAGVWGKHGGWGRDPKAWSSSLPLPGHPMTAAPRDSGCSAATPYLIVVRRPGQKPGLHENRKPGPGGCRHERPFDEHPLLEPPVSLTPGSSPPALPLERAKAARHL